MNQGQAFAFSKHYHHLLDDAQTSQEAAEKVSRWALFNGVFLLTNGVTALSARSNHKSHIQVDFTLNGTRYRMVHFHKPWDLAGEVDWGPSKIHINSRSVPS